MKTTFAVSAIILIMATGMASGQSTTVPDDRIVACFLPLDHAAAGQLADVLAPLLSPAGTITAYPPTNTLVIKDSAAMVKNLIKAVKGKKDLGACLNFQLQ